ncbi:hypothetical protein Ae406Ps2_6287 [Pseudonocardia sp. Ae406_Ps2]|uniref:antibiotic biosynthesis monooxygenase family protein n=1 Tax=unclassified Pseudonocardia TaxID=2619320 RepID=UPI00094AB690|nr:MULTISPECIES: antibiotic biosynthesis monooxygenase [unclassified Pseudonocardia]OLL89534.1 hypothetical protein Ae331Ps2_6208 [Pseudonocardia sp. Ae331_Ps2]OLL89985.1 hypothetical protein Ae406Ps2_6287 [Pseudonocardia sp. Ae406_Ps2]OLM08725.1 hypothetical protein Ae706Ps2_6677 [Pseudonocardia sp. Ae706_Ps2]
MSVVKIHVLAIPDAHHAELEERFTACRAAEHLADVPGFRSVELLRPTAGSPHYFLLSHWDDDAAYCDWLAHGRETAHGTTAHSTTYRAMTTTSVDLLEFDVVEPKRP